MLLVYLLRHTSHLHTVCMILLCPLPVDDGSAAHSRILSGSPTILFYLRASACVCLPPTNTTFAFLSAIILDAVAVPPIRTPTAGAFRPHRHAFLLLLPTTSLVPYRLSLACRLPFLTCLTGAENGEPRTDRGRATTLKCRATVS